MAVHADAQMLRQVARLARLSLDEAEVPRLVQELDRVLGLVAVLDEVDVRDVAPMVHPHGEAMALRADVVQPGLTQTAALGNAPAQDEGCFLTPRVIG